jgi:hypothetical protein
VKENTRIKLGTEVLVIAVLKLARKSRVSFSELTCKHVSLGETDKMFSTGGNEPIFFDF